MERRHFAVRIWVAGMAALLAAVLFIVVGGASRQAVASTDPGWSQEGWDEREDALRTDEEAYVFATDLAVYYRAIIPMPSQGFFVQNVELVAVTPLSGTGEDAVWRGEYLIVVGSTEVTGYAERLTQLTDFGPGIHPGDPTPRGVDGIFSYANLDPFSVQQRSGFLRYLMARGVPRVNTAARLDQPFPDAPWYEDTKYRASLLARGEEIGLGPENLVLVLYQDRPSELLGFDSKNGTWKRVP